MRHVIVGNGPAALGAVEALRRTDPACDITVVAGERTRAYTPCFLPRFISGEIAEEQLALRSEDFYEKHRVTLLGGVAATGVLTGRNAVALADGRALGYDRLLLACGASPVVPPLPGLAGTGVMTLESFDDAVALRALSALLGNVVVLGSGVVAVQVAEALVKLGMPVTLVARKERILRRVFDTEVSGMAEEHLTRNGVRIVKQRELREVERFGQRRELTSVVLSRGERLPCDLLIVAVGMQPNLARSPAAPASRRPGASSSTSGCAPARRTSLPRATSAEPDVAGVRRLQPDPPQCGRDGADRRQRDGGRRRAAGVTPRRHERADALRVFRSCLRDRSRGAGP